MCTILVEDEGGLRLPALTTLTEKFQGMADIRKSVSLFDLPLHFFHGTRINHQSHASAFSADNVVVMLPRVDQLVVTAGTIQIHFLGDLQVLQNRHDSKDSGIVRRTGISSGSRLDLFEGEGFLSSKQGIDYLNTVLGNPHAILSQKINDRF
jgi:hypothetical protein